MLFLLIVFFVGLIESSLTLDVIESRIINGDAAKITQFPWHVSVQGKLKTGQVTLCGGAFIAPGFVLTAAHCVTGLKYESFQLGFGSSNLTEPIVSMLVVPSQVTIHPEYRSALFANDLALIRMPHNLTYNTPNIAMVRLPALSHAKDRYADALAMITGFGRLNDESSISQQLRFARVRVIDPKQCSVFYGKAIVTENTLCTTGQTKSAQGACANDNGGPLVGLERTGYTLIGVASFVSNAGCNAGHPAGFVRLAPYVRWISTTAGIQMRP